MGIVGTDEVDRLHGKLEDHLSLLGFECHPLLTGWYNAKVSDKFALATGSEHTLAFVILSQPSMFEKTFLPWLQKNYEDANCSNRDPLDTCLLNTIAGLSQALAAEVDGRLEVLHDFQLRPNRRPKVLVQTAAHVAGAVHFFQPAEVQDQDQLRSRIDSPKIYSVCLHPRFGGWFAIRAVIILHGVEAPTLPPRACEDHRLLLNDDQKMELLRLYNDHWRDWHFRDCIEPEERYSQLQRDYFATKPGERLKLIEGLIRKEQQLQQ